MGWYGDPPASSESDPVHQGPPRSSCTAETNVRRRAIRRIRGSRSQSITIAVGLMAQERPALHDAAASLPRPYRIFPARREMKIGAKPVGAPFPRVADHRIQSIPVRLKRIDRARPRVSILRCIDLRKLALPYVAAMFPARPY